MPIASVLLTSWDRLGVVVAAGVFAVAIVGLLATSRRAGRPPRPPPGTGSSGRQRAEALLPSPGDPGSPAGEEGPDGIRLPPDEGGPADGPVPATSPAGARLPGLSRRQLVERGAIGLLAASLVGVLTSSVDYVATALGHPGRRYRVGTPAALRAHARSKGTPYYDAVGGFYVVEYPAADLRAARRQYDGAVLDGMEHGFVALDQACTHLGCRVPWCASSRWFECPCHGSRYNAVGEQRRGPAPRGLDRYAVTIEDGQVIVDTRRRLLGPPPGTDTTHQAPAGPHCY